MEERGYTVVRPLGQGAQGRVYEVTDATGRSCILKQLPWVGEGSQQRTLQEVRVLSSLRHPCIVPYLDSFLARSMPSLPTEDILCLIMGRCDYDLRHACRERRSQNMPFEEPHVLSWLAQLCWGLQHLHSRRLLHRDLKPQNVLLLRDGTRALLADFGVCGSLEHTHDCRHSIVGTPSFMSPEMLRGRPYGFKTDQWALGCVLFEIMALEAPFACCESYVAVVSAVLAMRSLPAPPGYSQDLSGTVESLMAITPEERPSSGELLARPMLSTLFAGLLRDLTEEVEIRGGRRASPAPLEDVDAASYTSDFESYSGSEAASDRPGDGDEEVLGSSQEAPKTPGNVGLGEWRHLFAEAKALLRPSPAVDAAEEAGKVWTRLCKALGSQARVHQALGFLRERKPLGDTSEADELVLQIEMLDILGDEGIHALPLLERCLVLERRTSGEAAAATGGACLAE